eukprot:TRINITY_DN13349_c0_g1_i1.p1 TRINITY_DN13349_c0_g1~~TRINITY_DN13349_c0_g1_i1.p1  ORF type:complete len:673 (-),score=133.83 TRINITY_DN13349_c0_g1_i1:210-2228(-)
MVVEDSGGTTSGTCIAQRCGAWRVGFSQYLLALEKYADEEFTRLEDVIVQLTRENQQLADSLGLKGSAIGKAADVASPRVASPKSAGLINACAPAANGFGMHADDALPLDIVVANQFENELNGSDGDGNGASNGCGGEDGFGGLGPLKRTGSCSLPRSNEYKACRDAQEAAALLVKDRKKKVQEALNPHEYTVFDLYYQTGWLQAIAKSPVFEGWIMAVVVLNAVYIAIDLDLNTGQSIFFIADNLFCLIFCSELVVRLGAAQQKLLLFSDRWFFFDLVLVLIMVIETWVIPLIMMIIGDAADGGMANVSVLRLLRLVRVTRVAKVMRVVPELAIMIKGMLVGIRSVVATCMMLGCITYCFAIIFRQTTADTQFGQDNFRTVPVAMYALLVEAVIPDNGDTLDALNKHEFVYAFLFLIFLFCTSLTVLNMLVGVMCEVMSETAQDRKAAMEVEQMTCKLREILKVIDEDFDERVSRKELDGVLQNEGAVRELHHYGVDVLALVEDADLIFESHGDDEGLSFLDFADVISHYRACNRTTFRAVFDIRNLLRRGMTRLGDRLRLMEEALDHNLGHEGGMSEASMTARGLAGGLSPTAAELASLANASSQLLGFRSELSRAAEILGEESHLLSSRRKSHASGPGHKEADRPRCLNGQADVSPDAASVAGVEIREL